MAVRVGAYLLIALLVGCSVSRGRSQGYNCCMYVCTDFGSTSCSRALDGIVTTAEMTVNQTVRPLTKRLISMEEQFEAVVEDVEEGEIDIDDIVSRLEKLMDDEIDRQVGHYAEMLEDALNCVEIAEPGEDVSPPPLDDDIFDKINVTEFKMDFSGMQS